MKKSLITTVISGFLVFGVLFPKTSLADEDDSKAKEACSSKTSLCFHKDTDSETPDENGMPTRVNDWHKSDWGHCVKGYKAGLGCLVSTSLGQSMGACWDRGRELGCAAASSSGDSTSGSLWTSPKSDSPSPFLALDSETRAENYCRSQFFDPSSSRFDICTTVYRRGYCGGDDNFYYDGRHNLKDYIDNPNQNFKDVSKEADFVMAGVYVNAFWTGQHDFKNLPLDQPDGHHSETERNCFPPPPSSLPPPGQTTQTSPPAQLNVPDSVAQGQEISMAYEGPEVQHFLSAQVWVMQKQDGRVWTKPISVKSLKSPVQLKIPETLKPGKYMAVLMIHAAHVAPRPISTDFEVLPRLPASSQATITVIGGHQSVRAGDFLQLKLQGFGHQSIEDFSMVCDGGKRYEWPNGHYDYAPDQDQDMLQGKIAPTLETLSCVVTVQGTKGAKAVLRDLQIQGAARREAPPPPSSPNNITPFGNSSPAPVEPRPSPKPTPMPKTEAPPHCDPNIPHYAQPGCVDQ